MENFGVVWLREPLKTINRGWLRWFGTAIDETKGDVSGFDQRGAYVIRGGKKSVEDAGGNSDAIAIYRPGGSQAVPASKAMDSHFGWVYACVKAVSDEMANIQFRLFSISGEGDHEEEPTHELLDLLDGVNEYQTGPEFRKILGSHLEMTGNAYIYLFGVKNFDQKPKAMYLLNPGRTKVVLDKTTFPYKVLRYEMIEDSRKFTFQPYEIAHVKYPDPNDPYIGMGTVQGIAEWIDNDNYAMEYNRNFFKNGARMSGVFETDMNSIEQTQRLKISFEEQFSGVKNAYKTMIMPKGVKWVPTQVTAKDMDFDKLLNATAERILAGFRVSKTILGTAESDTNRATAETADYVFAKRTIKPKMELIVSFLNEFIVPRYGDNLYLSFDDPVPEDKAFRTTEMQAAVGQKQVITQNEAREEFMGLGPVDDPAADKITGTAPVDPTKAASPSNGTPAGDGKSARKKIATLPAKAARAKKGKTSFKTQFARNMQTRQNIAKAVAENVAEFIKKIGKKNAVEMTDEEYLAVVYTHTKSRIDEFEPKIREALHKINKRQMKEVKANLSRAIKTSVISKKAIVPSKLFDMKSWIKITVDALTPIAAELFNKESSAALMAIGASPTAVSTEALTERMLLLGRSYNQTIMDTLESKLNEGLSAGMSLPQLSDSVSEIYTWADDYAATRVAKTETVAISNMANKQAWTDAGTVKTVRWYTSQKDNVCPFCQAMNGEVIDINANFLDLGDSFTADDGSTMTADYSDIGGPPLHPNCGCLIRPDSFNPITASVQNSDKKEDDVEDKVLDELISQAENEHE